jgi:hypothetical protein
VKQGRPNRSKYHELLDFIEGKTTLTRDEQAAMNSLLWPLQEEWLYLWLRTKERGLLSEIISLAHRLQSLGRENGIAVVALYGRELEERALSFDHAEYEEILNLFPQLVKALGKGRS